MYQIYLSSFFTPQGGGRSRKQPGKAKRNIDPVS